MAHWVLARIAAKEKNPAEAEREYRAAIITSHSGTRAWLDLAIFLLTPTVSMKWIKRFIRWNPVRSTVPSHSWTARSLLLQTGRDYPMAVRLCRRYLESPVEEGPAFKAHDYLGQLLEKQGDRRAAAEEFRAALALSHNYARAQEDLKRVEH